MFWRLCQKQRANERRSHFNPRPNRVDIPLSSPHSILLTFYYKKGMKISREICYVDVTTVKRISEHLSNYL